MSDIRHIPHEGPRIETGALQVGDDWPGVFIRGDRALFIAIGLATIPKPENANGELALGRIIRLLRSCKVGETGWPPAQPLMEDKG